MEKKIGEQFSPKQKEVLANVLAKGFLKLEMQFKQQREQFLELFVEEVKKSVSEVEEERT